MGILTYSMKPITEAYYGKPKEFITIEKELNKLITLIKKENPKIIQTREKISSPIKVTDLNKHDSVITIEKLFKKFFGFGGFYLCFYYPVSQQALTIPFNAYTMPRTFTFFHKGYSGKLDVENMHVGVNVDILLITYLDMSAEELMAVILHEIGHNMDVSFFTFLARMPIGLNIMVLIEKFGIGVLINMLISLGLLDIFGAGGGLTVALKRLESFLVEKLPWLIKATTIFWEGFLNIITVFKIKNFIKLMEHPQNIILQSLSTKNIMGYADEKHADSFATAYGYGLANASFQNKIQKQENLLSNKMINEIPLLNWGYDLFNVSLGLLTCIADPHPQDAVRVNSQLIKLKRDLKNPDLNPRLKKALEDDIKQLQDFIDNYYLNFKENDNSRRIFSWLLNYMTIKILNNKVDYRELFELISNHEV